MNNNGTQMAWRDVVLSKLDYHCTRFNRGWKRGESWFKGILPYLVVAVAVLFLWDGVISPGLHSWVAQHPGWVSFLNRHDGWAYVYGYGLFLVVPLFFAVSLTIAVFRLVRAVQCQRQKRPSSETSR